MKKTISFLCLIWLAVFVKAQTPAGNSLTGILKDSSIKSPLEYDTVTIFEKDGKTPVTGTTTDKEGAFILNEIPPGIYRIVFECIGYKTYTMNDVSLNKKEAIIDLKNV